MANGDCWKRIHDFFLTTNLAIFCVFENDLAAWRKYAQNNSFFAYMLKMHVRLTECFIFLVSLHITQSWGFVMIN